MEGKTAMQLVIKSLKQIEQIYGSSEWRAISIVETFLETEKQQIIDAYKNGMTYFKSDISLSDSDSEIAGHYYNQTYNQ